MQIPCHHEAHEVHEEIREFLYFNLLLRALRDLRGELFLTHLVAALPRWARRHISQTAG